MREREREIKRERERKGERKGAGREREVGGSVREIRKGNSAGQTNRQRERRGKERNGEKGRFGKREGGEDLEIGQILVCAPGIDYLLRIRTH